MIQLTVSKAIVPSLEKNADKLLRTVFRENSDDAASINVALGSAIKAHGVSKIAKEAGLRREGLYRSFLAGRNASFKTVLKVLKALGCRLKLERIEKK